MTKKKQSQPDVLQADIVPGSKLVLHGREYQLAFPFKSVILYKQKTGDSLFDSENWKKLVEPENMLAAIWASFAVYHPEITFDEVSCLIDLSNVKDAEAAIAQCLQSYFPKPKPVEGEIPNEAPLTASAS